jgi:hypothetical protein
MTFDDILMNPVLAVCLYGGLLLMASVIAWSTGDTCLRKLSVWMGVAWVADNAIYHQVGPELASSFIPGVNAIITINIAAKAWRHHCPTCWTMVGLFCLGFAVAVAGFVTKVYTSPAYYGVQNVIFLARVVVLGGAGIVGLVGRARERDPRTHQRTVVALHGHQGEMWRRRDHD